MFPNKRPAALRSKSINCFDSGELVALLTNNPVAHSFAPVDFESDSNDEIGGQVQPRVRRNSFVVVSSAAAPRFMRRNRSAQAALLLSLAEAGAFVDDEEVPSPPQPDEKKDGAEEDYVFMTAARSAEEEQKRAERQARKDARTARRQFMKDLRQQIDEAKRRHRTLSISASSAPEKRAWFKWVQWTRVNPQILSSAQICFYEAFIRDLDSDSEVRFEKKKQQVDCYPIFWIIFNGPPGLSTNDFMVVLY